MRTVRLGLLAVVAAAGCWVSPDPALWQHRPEGGTPDLQSLDARLDAIRDGRVPDGDALPPDGSGGDGPGSDALPAQSTIYRSVGPGSSGAVASGSSGAELIIAGGVASFAQPLPGAVGVGDVLVYDLDGDGVIDGSDGLAVVQRRQSSTALEVRTADGGAPSAVGQTADWSVFRAYTSLTDALVGTENSGIAQGLRDFDSWSGGADLVALGKSWAIACYADAKETDGVVVDGWTTSAQHTLRIFAPADPSEVGSSQRHSGKAGTGFVVETGSSGHVFDIRSDHVQLEGLEITGWVNDVSNGSWEGVHIAADHVLLDGLLIHDDLHPNTTNPNADAINLNDMQTGQTVTVRNTVVYNISRGAVNYQGALALVVNIESCTFHNTGTSLTQGDDQGGINISSTGATLNVVNTISVGSSSGADFKSGGGWGSSSNNISSDASAPGSSSQTQKLATDLFVAATQGAEDLHLAVGSPAVDQGKDLSASFSNDIDGQTRSAPWDIGADER